MDRRNNRGSRHSSRIVGALFRLGLILIVLFLAGGCSERRMDYLSKLRIFEDEGYSDQGVSEDQIATLEEEIVRLEGSVEELVSSVRELGTFYKMAATDFFDGGNYLPALEYFEKAIPLQTENHVLPYYAALSAVNLGIAHADAATRSQYLEKGEFYYLRALDLKSNYSDSMYGLAVLYLYELDRPLDSLEYIEEYLAIKKSNIRGRFVKAGALVQLGDREAALDEYQWILENSDDSEEQRQARGNLESLLGGR